MIKKLKPAILLLIPFLCLQVASGQNQDVVNYLKERLQSYSRSFPWEDIYIHTDRQEYISGEDMWFKVYVLDRQSFKPSLNSRLVYFELLNSENRPVVQKRILITNGSGPGQVVLPDTLGTGTYTLRAYTNRMKNFLPANCFTAEITVFNALKSSTFKKISHPVTGNTDTGIKEEKGLTVKLDNTKPGILRLDIRTDESYRNENSSLVYVFIQTRGNINHVSVGKLEGPGTLIEIPRSELTAGINQITLFNSKAEVVYEKYIYTSAKDINPLVVHSTDSCGLREKITLGIQSVSGTAVKTSVMSISVAPFSDKQIMPDITDYMIFGSEFGAVPLQALNGKSAADRIAITDSLLDYVKSNWINWSVILSDNPPKLKYQPEKEEHFLSGKLTDVNSQNVAPGSILIMSSPGKQAGFQYARTDNDGYFSFRVHIDEDVKDLIIMPDEVSKSQKITIEPSFSDKYLKSESVPDSSEASLLKEVSRLSINHQVQKIYGVSETGSPLKLSLSPEKPSRFYGKPDIELVLADYIKLPVMSEIFFELLPGVSLKRRRSSAEISITYHLEDELITKQPTLMIDGVIIKDPMLIANLDPELVEKIDVIRENYRVGKYIFPGLVNVITRAADFSSVPLPDYMIRLPYRVIDPVLSFASPDYSIDSLRQSRIPDYRNTLYWNPSATFGNDGKVNAELWSTDNKADYLLDIEGITGDGKFFSFRKIVKVK